MKIYFVRHGHPDYKNDCLTELGHRQAEAVAVSLENSKIERIFSSSMGRALETAQHTAKKLRLDVIPCDFMREIDIGDKDIFAGGDPWKLATIYAKDGKSQLNEHWQTHEHFCENKVTSCYKTVIRGFDKWLENLGYKREGEYYRVLDKVPNNVVAMFSHGGSSTAAMSHLFNIPFPRFCGMTHIELASVIIVEFLDEPMELVYPKLIFSN